MRIHFLSLSLFFSLPSLPPLSEVCACECVLFFWLFVCFKKTWLTPKFLLTFHVMGGLTCIFPNSPQQLAFHGMSLCKFCWLRWSIAARRVILHLSCLVSLWRKRTSGYWRTHKENDIWRWRQRFGWCFCELRNPNYFQPSPPNQREGWVNRLSITHFRRNQDHQHFECLSSRAGDDRFLSHFGCPPC